MSKRRSLSELGLPTGSSTRLHRLLHRHRRGHGTAMSRQYGSGPEHELREFSVNPAAPDPDDLVTLAVERGRHGVALQVGSAESVVSDLACTTAVINGGTNGPRDQDESPDVVERLRDVLSRCPSGPAVSR